MTNTQNEDLTLHKMVFKNDIDGATEYLNSNKNVLSQEQPIKDMHGNTPLHLAVMLGHHELAKVLVQNGHGIHNRNHQGWTPLQESISYGNRPIIENLLKNSRKNGSSIKERKSNAQSILESFDKNMRLKINWDFSSWIPFVSNILPSDTCTVYCKDKYIRMDSTLEDFNNLKWVRGDLTLIADFNVLPKPSILLLDNNKKVYYRMDDPSIEETEANLNEDIDILMSSDIVDACIKTKQASVDRQNSGWLFRHEKTEKVGQFNASVYKISNLNFTQKKRREHLTERDIQRNKHLRETLSRPTSFDSSLMAEDETEHRDSLPPPSKPNIDWDQYANLANNYCLGRTKKEKQTTKVFDANISMSTEFPVKLEQLLSILEMLGPKAKLYKRIREFVDVRLPPGFPVRINIPIVPTVKGTVSFVEFEYCDSLDQSLFKVPSSYKQESSWHNKSK